MFKFSKKVEYALISLVTISEKDSESLTTARELSSEFNISQELLGKILQTLCKNRILVSIQGVKGGYKLAISPDELTLHRIIAVIDHPLHVVDCFGKNTNKNKKCPLHIKCIIRNPMVSIQLKMSELLEKIKLSDFSNNRAEILGKKTKKDKSDNIRILKKDFNLEGI